MKTSPTIILLLDIKISVAQLLLFVCLSFYRAVIKGPAPPPPPATREKKISRVAV